MMKHSLTQLIEKYSTLENKITLGLATAGFTLSFLGMTLDDLIQDKPFFEAISQPAHHITPIATSILMGVVGYIGGKGYIKTRRLEEEEDKRQENILNDPTIGFFSCKEDGKFLFVNNSFAEMFGYENPETMLKEGNMKALYSVAEERYQLLGELSENKSIYNKRLKLKTKTGEELSFVCNAHYIKDKRITGTVEKVDEKVQNIITACMYCDKIRESTDERGVQTWIKATQYIMMYKKDMINPDKDYQISHGICQDCFKEQKWMN